MYSLPDEANVTLRIENTFQKEITTLVSNYQMPGMYSVNWNGKDNKGNELPPGLYHYTLTAGDFTDSKSMLMIIAE